MTTNPELSPKKDYYAPMHTAEHILNQTMVRVFGCARSKTNHIEKDKSKCDYFLPVAPTEEQMREVEALVNDVVASQLPVTAEELPRDVAEKSVDLSSLPEQVSTVRLVRVGGYDVCPCIGKHVQNTREIGRFKLFSWDYQNGRLRVRFKLEK
ncbi:hypothetical protein [Candidatus Avelusimicrobium gallicola]|uniref:Threonyl/alanyl tRNA synthetase SAD domain-containing protein n=1 Tax=Candidatus Avelusimicrobium gallicola TaxID=2562704 RepID=A0A1Y4DKH8_9BACT|nr:hypothetical protein [Elusimicrobium sp. An273]OUO56800.1 hypothetical protein B5F75_02850 [Elusimicrobium sp. An273]